MVSCLVILYLSCHVSLFCFELVFILPSIFLLFQELWWPIVRRVAQYLPSQMSVDFVAFDLPGHGESKLAPPPPVDNWWERGVDYARETVAHYGRGYDQILALGHSFGAASLMLLEAEQPGTFSRLVVYEPIILPMQTPPHLRDMMKQHPLVFKAKQQRNGWKDMAEAHSYFASRKAFRTWNTEVFELFLDNCLRRNESTGEMTLRLEPELEASAFQALPWHFDKLLTMRAESAVMFGELSTNLDGASPMSTVSLYKSLAKAVPGLGHAVECTAAGHLMVCEHPDLVAEHCAKYLLGLGSHQQLPGSMSKL